MSLMQVLSWRATYLLCLKFNKTVKGSNFSTFTSPYYEKSMKSVQTVKSYFTTKIIKNADNG